MVARQLPIVQNSGELVERPGLMLIAATVHADVDEICSTYEAMLLDEREARRRKMEALTEFGRVLERKLINREVGDRALAALTVLELLRIGVVTGEYASLREAREQIAFERGHCRREGTKKAASFDHFVDRVRKAFRRYEPVAHYLAAFAFDAQTYEEAEVDEDAVRRAIGLARGFEIFIDQNRQALGRSWRPIRVPEVFEPVTKLSFDRSILEAPLYREVSG